MGISVDRRLFLPGSGRDLVPQSDADRKRLLQSKIVGRRLAIEKFAVEHDPRLEEPDAPSLAHLIVLSPLQSEHQPDVIQVDRFLQAAGAFDGP